MAEDASVAEASESPTAGYSDAELAEFVVARHPDLTTPASFTRRAYLEVYGPQGWVDVNAVERAVIEVTGEDQPPVDDQGAVDLHRLTKADLVRVGVSLGLDLDESDRKDALISAIDAARGAGEGVAHAG